MHRIVRRPKLEGSQQGHRNQLGLIAKPLACEPTGDLYLVLDCGENFLNVKNA